VHVDNREPCALRPRYAALSERCDGRGMDRDCAAHSARPSWGRKRSVDIREVFNGLLYVLSTGCQWRALPKDFPPRSTIFHYFGLWEADGTLRRVHAALSVKGREQADRAATPTACIIDRQSVKSAEKGGRRSIRRALTRANRSKGKSVTSSSIPWGLSCMRSPIRPTCKIATEGFCFSRGSPPGFRSW
jgi:transposase